MSLEIGKIWAQKFRQIATVLGSAISLSWKKIPTESYAFYWIEFSD